jgi:hypothetical protein
MNLSGRCCARSAWPTARRAAPADRESFINRPTYERTTSAVLTPGLVHRIDEIAAKIADVSPPGMQFQGH